MCRRPVWLEMGGEEGNDGSSEGRNEVWRGRGRVWSRDMESIARVGAGGEVGW